MICWVGKVVLFFVIMHLVLLNSAEATGSSGKISWFPEYEKYKPTHYGKHFILGLILPGDDDSVLDQISILALFDTNVTITSPTLSKNPLYTGYMNAGENVQYSIPRSLRLSYGVIGIARKGVEVNASNDIAVMVLLREGEPSSRSDALIVLPTNVLGTHYIVPTWNHDYGYPLFAVIACHNTTTVIIKLHMSRNNFKYKGYSYGNGSTLNLTLDKLETFHVFGYIDLSGTIITANKPIVMISGGRNTSISSGVQDNLASFLLPAKNWGKNFILAAVGTTSVGDKFRIFAKERNTEVYRANRRIANLQPGDHAQLDLSYDSSISSFVNCSKPCQVTQYLHERSRSGFYSSAGPSMINLPSIEQFLPAYYVVPLGGSTYKHSITLVIKDYVKDGLLMDGKSLTGLSWQTVKSTKYRWTIVDISKSVYIAHSIPQVLSMENIVETKE